MSIKTHELLYNWLVDIKVYGTSVNIYKEDNGFYNEMAFLSDIFLPEKLLRAKETHLDRHTLCKLLSIGDKRMAGIYNKDFRKCCACVEIFESRFTWCPCCGRLLRIKKRDKAHTMYDKMHDKSGY